MSPFVFTFGDVAADGSLHVVGVVRELEDQDVPHSILWERIDGAWKRYQWNNRVYDMASYANAFALLGYDGALKIRSRVSGSSVEQLEVGDDAPSSRRVRGIRRIGDALFVVGMRRMVYRRSLHEAVWSRCDEGVRLSRADLALSAFDSIDGVSPQQLIAVGSEVWSFQNGAWTRDASLDGRFFEVRRVGEAFVVGGDGVLLLGDVGNWRAVKHEGERFVSVESWSNRCFVATESGPVFELKDDALTPMEVEAHRLFASPERVYFLSTKQLRSLGADGWRDETPPPELLS